MPETVLRRLTHVAGGKSFEKIIDICKRIKRSVILAFDLANVFDRLGLYAMVSKDRFRLKRLRFEKDLVAFGYNAVYRVKCARFYFVGIYVSFFGSK